MATNAERQAAFRQRRAQHGDFARIDMVVEPALKDSLEALATRYALPQVATFRKLVTDALAAGDKPPEPPQGIEERYTQHKQEAQATLSETAKQKLERFMAQERKLLNEAWHEQLRAEKNKLREEFERSVPELIAGLEEQKEKALRETLKYQSMRGGLKAFMSLEEYRMVRSVCHPDREADKERKEKAFHVMQRFDDYFDTGKKEKPEIHNRFSAK